MRIQHKWAAVTAALTLAGTPAVALGHDHPPHPKQAKSYGYYCRDESKKHVAGQHGTAFSKCVRALRKVDTGDVSNPARACKRESKKHVAGRTGTPFSRCVMAAAQLQADKSDG